MGTYIHPSTTNVSLLEQLANVPLGTAERLAALEAQFPNLHSFRPEHMHEHDSYFKAKSADPSLDSYDSFILYGWGRLTPAAAALIESWGLSPAIGGTSDRNRIYQLLRDQGVPKACTIAARIDAIHWS